MTGPERPEFLRVRAATEAAEGDSAAAEKDLKEASKSSRATAYCFSATRIFCGRRTELKKLRRPTLKRWQSMHRIRAHWAHSGTCRVRWATPRPPATTSLNMRRSIPTTIPPIWRWAICIAPSRQFAEAQENYEQAFKRSPDNPLIVSGAMNAALEAHQFPRAGEWLARASRGAQQNPQVMREHERYLTMTGKYAESAELGYQVIRSCRRIARRSTTLHMIFCFSIASMKR